MYRLVVVSVLFMCCHLEYAYVFTIIKINSNNNILTNYKINKGDRTLSLVLINKFHRADFAVYTYSAVEYSYVHSST